MTKKLLWVVLIIFVLLAVIGVLNHSLWPDEAQPWLIAVDSHSIVDLFQNMRSEGHPCGWFLPLYVLSFFTDSHIALQLFNVSIAITIAYLVLFKSPFRTIEKIFFIFGFFPFYEYCLISNKYGMMMLLTFMFFILYQKKPTPWIWLSVVLVAMTNTHAYSAVLAVCLALVLVWEWFVDRRHNVQPVTNKKARIALAIVILGLLFYLLQLSWMKGENVTESGKHLFAPISLRQAEMSLWRGYVPIPEGFPYWPTMRWSTNFIDATLLPQYFLCTVFSITLLCIGAWVLRDRIKECLIYLFLTLSVLIAEWFTGAGTIRHAGILYTIIIAIFWVVSEKSKGTTSSKACEGRKSFLMFLLICNLLAGVYSYSVELVRPFCSSLEAAEFIQDKHLDKLPIVASQEFQVMPISLYLNKPIYYINSSRWGKHAYILIKEVNTQEVLATSIGMLNTSNTPVVVVLTFPIMLEGKTPPTPFVDGYVEELKNVRLTRLGRFTGSIAKEPNYYVYLMRKEKRER